MKSKNPLKQGQLSQPFSNVLKHRDCLSSTSLLLSAYIHLRKPLWTHLIRVVERSQAAIWCSDDIHTAPESHSRGQVGASCFWRYWMSWKRLPAVRPSGFMEMSRGGRHRCCRSRWTGPGWIRARGWSHSEEVRLGWARDVLSLSLSSALETRTKAVW